MKEIGIGIIGYGFMGRTHTYGIKNLPLFYDNLPYKVKLVGVCDANLAAAQEAKERNDFVFATDQADEILARKDIDAVTVSTPNVFHYEILKKAVRAGKAVYCDKPLVSTVEEADEIVALAKKHGTVNQMAFQYRFFPATMRAKQLIEEGRIGKLMSFNARYLHSGNVDAKKPVGWKQDKKLGGGGVLFDLGSHIIDLMRYFIGDFASVFSSTRTVYKTRPNGAGEQVENCGEDLAYLIVGAADGVKGCLEASKIATGTNDELSFELYGDRGALKFNLMDPNYLAFFDNGLPEKPLGGERGFKRIECVQRFEKPSGYFPNSKFAMGWLRGHAHCLFNFVDNVFHGRQCSPDFADGAYIQKFMARAYESAELGKSVELEENL